MDDMPLSPEDDLRLLTRIINRSGISNYATPWMQDSVARVRFYIEHGELKPCARIVKKTVTEGVEYEVSVFYRGKNSVASKIKDLNHARAIADLMLQQFGVTLVNNQGE